MFTEQYKDQVYFSSTFSSDYKATYEEIIAILNDNHVKHGLLRNTTDYWCRDYMPIQDGHGYFRRFYYHPDYLEDDRKSETPPEVVNNNTRRIIKSVFLSESEIIADGGNFTVCTTKRGNDVIVMTEKIFAENHTLSKEDIIKEIEGKFNHEILFLPWDKEDKYGHTDGIVHNIGDGQVLVNLDVYSPEIAEEMRKRLDTMFDVVDLKLSSYHDDSWAYINMLQTRDVIIVPGLGLDTDREALEQIKALHPEYEGRIYMVNLSEIVTTWGGALNCLTWTISTESSKIHHTAELDAKYKDLLKKGKKDAKCLSKEEIDFLGRYNAPKLNHEAVELGNLYFEQLYS